MSVEVVIGHHADDDTHRTAARQWVTGWYRTRGYRVTVACATGTPWCKADAYNGPVADSTADVVVLADADSFPAADALQQAIVAATRVGWAAPFRKVRRLTADATLTLLDCTPDVDQPPRTDVEADVHDVLPGGGIVVMRRSLALACGPYDPRFAGWGGEDYALGNAARTLSKAAAALIPGPLWHCWHPRGHAQMSPATKALSNRYRRALFDSAAMQALIEEWRAPC